jgi:urea transport system ATP-binding protein
LKLEDLVVAYGQSTIIRGINLEVPENELVCLMGRNGVGKTTTLKTIVGLLRPKSGVIAMDGRQLDRLTTSERARSGIAYVPQGRDIFPGLTVWENLQTSIVVKGKAARAQVDRVFELFPALKGMLKRKGGVLSGGEQQQLAIGRALLLDPKLLILDEPTEGIQPSIIDQIEDTLLALKVQGLSLPGPFLQLALGSGWNSTKWWRRPIPILAPSCIWSRESKSPKFESSPTLGRS